MSHFAEIDQDGIVQRVIVAEQDFIDKMPGTWVQTSYNTFGGEHKLGGTPLRMNYAGPGYKYDAARDAFIAPKPDDPTARLDEATCLWAVAAKPMPEISK